MEYGLNLMGGFFLSCSGHLEVARMRVLIWLVCVCVCMHALFFFMYAREEAVSHGLSRIPENDEGRRAFSKMNPRQLRALREEKKK